MTKQMLMFSFLFLSFHLQSERQMCLFLEGTNEMCVKWNQSKHKSPVILLLLLLHLGN